MSKTIAIMQPYFLPYIGYFQLISAVDEFIIFDDVNYIKQGFINRNSLLINGSSSTFTLSLAQSSSNKKINETRLLPDFQKFKKTCIYSYKKAPYFCDAIDLLNEILDFENLNLACFIIHSIEVVTKYLDIQANIRVSSEINKNEELKGQDKIIDMCKLLQAKTYINSIGGMHLYDANTFKLNDIKLRFLKPNITPYKQFDFPFVQNLSILDVLMFCSKDKIKEQLLSYRVLQSIEG